jgi:hypothetical protein
LITLGNHFFFKEYSEKYGQDIDIRHSKVNTYEDLLTLKQQLSLPNLTQTLEPYFPYHSVWSIPPILSILFSAKQAPLMKRSSSLNPQMLDEYNIIFLGSIKTLYILRYILSESHFDFEISPHKIIYTPPDSSETQIYETSLHSEGQNDDLVLALKLPGPVNNSIFLIASYHSLGAPEVANYLVQQSTRKQVEKLFVDRYGEMPEYFEMLFKVSGIDKTAYTTDILIYNKIEPK